MVHNHPSQPGHPILAPGTLWDRVHVQTQYALHCGALQPILTHYEFIEQGKIRFLVRTLSNLVRKEEVRQQQERHSVATGQDINPFLPYEEDLFVANLSETHVCLLNKFNVIDHHLLIITRAFEDQSKLLTLQDFEALWIGFQEIEGLAFYNGGKDAGASQRHKHLQLVPLPFVPSGPKIPIEPLLANTHFKDQIGITPDLPFVHALVQLEPRWVSSPKNAAQQTLERYYALLQAVGLGNPDQVSFGYQPGPYNLLATPQWMLIVPRSQEHFESISVNSLGFAGSLFVKNEQQMQLLKAIGPLTLLENVAHPWSLT
jgi:sulfate adenylyltransferase (ADP) / ATP adenylyltransferase